MDSGCFIELVIEFDLGSLFDTMPEIDLAGPQDAEDHPRDACCLIVGRMETVEAKLPVFLHRRDVFRLNHAPRTVFFFKDV